MLLKGASMSVLYYRDAGARPMADLDLLVRRSDLHAAIETLEAHGWRQAEGDTRAPARAARFTHARPSRGPGGNAIDLHWAPLYEPVEADGFWQAAVPASSRVFPPAPPRRPTSCCSRAYT